MHTQANISSMCARKQFKVALGKIQNGLGQKNKVVSGKRVLGSTQKQPRATDKCGNWQHRSDLGQVTKLASSKLSARTRSVEELIVTV